VRVERAQSLAGRIIGPYRVLDLLGAGGMGEAYTARDQHLERDVAIKVLPETFTHDRERIDRFRREPGRRARAAGRPVRSARGGSPDDHRTASSGMRTFPVESVPLEAGVSGKVRGVSPVSSRRNFQ
jgi:hypothetical protein